MMSTHLYPLKSLKPKYQISPMTERSCSLSIEEEQELARSNKKVKDSHNGAPIDTNICPGSTSFANKFSFRDKLMGDIPEAC